MQQVMRQKLIDQGWSPRRRVDIGADLAAYKTEGYPIWPELQAFLTEYAGIRVGDGDAYRDIWISGVGATRLADPGWIEAYEEVLGTRLAPVGGYQGMVLLLGSDGRLYGGFDREFGELGTNLPEAMQRLWHPNGALFEHRVTD